MNEDQDNNSIRTRMYLPEAGQTLLMLQDTDSLGVAKVMRLQPDQHIEAFNGDGMAYRYSVQHSSRSELQLKLVDAQFGSREPGAGLSVWIASTKGKTNDRMLKDMVALGVTAIVVYAAERSVRRPADDSVDRYRKLAIEACRQCGRCTVPEINIQTEGIPALSNVIPDTQALIVFDETALQAGISTELCSRDPVTVVFGPEGGFSPDERENLRALGGQTAGLGRRILRAELAVTVGVSLIQQLRGELA